MSELADLVRRVRLCAWSRPDFFPEWQVVRWAPLDRQRDLHREAAEAFEAAKDRDLADALATLLDTAEVAILDLRSRWDGPGEWEAAFAAVRDDLDLHRIRLREAPLGWDSIRQWAETGPPPDLVELAERRQRLSEDAEMVTGLRLKVKDGPEVLTVGEIVPMAVSEVRAARAELLNLKAGAAA